MVATCVFVGNLFIGISVLMSCFCFFVLNVVVIFAYKIYRKLSFFGRNGFSTYKASSFIESVT